jgi:hypothetical protein
MAPMSVRDLAEGSPSATRVVGEGEEFPSPKKRTHEKLWRKAMLCVAPGEAPSGTTTTEASAGTAARLFARAAPEEQRTGGL